MFSFAVVLALLSEVPADVRYVKAAPAVNAAAKKTVEQMFTGSPPKLEQGSGAGVLLLGPFLGQRVAQLDMSDFLKQRIVVPFTGVTAEMTSYGARNPAERTKLLALLKDLAPTGPVKIRALTAEEMKIIWAFISWDLTEPIFVVESSERKWIVDFDDAGTTPFWIEELTAPCFTAAELDGKCLCVQAKKTGREWKLAFVEGKPCVAGAPKAPENPLGLSVDVADLNALKLLIPEAKMQQRVTIEALLAYVKRLMAAVTDTVRAHAGKKQGAVTVSVAVKPGGERRVWVDAATEAVVPRALLRSLTDTLRGLEAPDTRGVIVFQLLVQVGGGEKLRAEDFPSVPPVWSEAAKKEKDGIDVESLMLELWSTPEK